MYESLFNFPSSFLAEFDRLQNALSSLNLPSSIRATTRGAFPAINIGTTGTSIEVYAFAPGLDPSKIDVSVDRGLLTISGERSIALNDASAKSANESSASEDEQNIYATERFQGSFKRVITLPEDTDPTKVEAKYQDGVLRITLARREPPQPKRIQIQ